MAVSGLVATTVHVPTASTKITLPFAPLDEHTVGVVVENVTVKPEVAVALTVIEPTPTSWSARAPNEIDWDAADVCAGIWTIRPAAVVAEVERDPTHDGRELTRDGHVDRASRRRGVLPHGVDVGAGVDEHVTFPAPIDTRPPAASFRAWQVT